MIWRILLSALAAAFYVAANLILGPTSAIIGSRLAAGQFQDSNSAYFRAVAGAGAASWIGIPAILLLVVLLLIWWRPARNLLARLSLGLAALAATAPPGFAYFDTTDRTEAYTILPNESAFWIPDVGANKASQGQFDSEDYLNAHKVALKRFVIPHQKLSGSGGTSLFSGWDDYVPTGRLIIVDRTPYSREWVDAADRGTSSLKEGFPCQSKEGLNIAVGVSIGAEVTEADAAKYLYHFGVDAPRGSRTDPKVIFQSVYYSRTVANVMDDVGRKKVQSLMCNEISARTFDEDNAQAVQIMRMVRDAAAKYFASVGITLDFLGWADTFRFDPDVQDAVNRHYIAGQDKAIATELSSYAGVLQELAAAKALLAFGNKTDGKLPTTIVGLPPNIGALLKALLDGNPAASASTAAVQR